MNLHEVIRRRVRRRMRGVDLESDVNAVVAATVGEHGKSTAASSRQTVVQRGRRTARTDTRGGST